MNSNKTLINNNKLIDEFMGIKISAYKGNHGYKIKFDTFNECEKWINENKLITYKAQVGWDNISNDYHDSWDLLMLVYKKYCEFINASKSYSTSPDLYNICAQIRESLLDGNIEKLHKWMIEFIKWYNKNQ